MSKYCYEEKENASYKIPTPFKKCLVFPSTVVSSGKYRECYNNEAKKKLVPKRKNKTVSSIDENSSDSDVNLTYNDDDLGLSENEDVHLQVGEYVIVKYEGTYYLGE